MLFFSRLPKRTRLVVFGGLVGVARPVFRLLPLQPVQRKHDALLSSGAGPIAPCPRPTTKRPSQPGKRPLIPWLSCRSRSSSAQAAIAKSPAPALATDWSAEPPEKLWRQPIGAAWSGFAVAAHRAVTQEQRDENEAVVCYNVQTGSVLWLHTDSEQYKTAIAGEGPRATPTIHNGRVYTLGATGVLNCLELATGKPVWKRDIAIDAGLDLDAPVDQIADYHPTGTKPRNGAMPVHR